MNDELKHQIYRKLLPYLERKIPVHFCLVKGGWKNGDILDLSLTNLTLVLKEFKEGELPFLLEDIDVDSIRPFKKKQKVEE